MRGWRCDKCGAWGHPLEDAAAGLITVVELARKTTNPGELRNLRRQFDHRLKDLREQVLAKKGELQALLPQTRAPSPIPPPPAWQPPVVEAVPPPPAFLRLLREPPPSPSTDAPVGPSPRGLAPADDPRRFAVPPPHAALAALRAALERDDPPPSRAPAPFAALRARSPGCRPGCACATCCAAELPPDPTLV